VVVDAGDCGPAKHGDEAVHVLVVVEAGYGQSQVYQGCCSHERVAHTVCLSTSRFLQQVEQSRDEKRLGECEAYEEDSRHCSVQKLPPQGFANGERKFESALWFPSRRPRDVYFGTEIV
jgi:hypothetical protein